MPRRGWLAVGGVLAALAVPALAAGREAAVAAALGSLVLVLWLAVRGPAGRPAIALAAGAWLIAIRLTIAPAGPLETAPPPPEGPWTMAVEAVGSPREGRQVATLRLLGPPSATTVSCSSRILIRPGRTGPL